MQDELMIKYIKKKKEKGMEILIDSYRGIITSVVRKHLGVLIIYAYLCRAQQEHPAFAAPSSSPALSPLLLQPVQPQQS